MLSALQTKFLPREARKTVRIPSRMRVGEVWMDICIRNLSSRGMLVQCQSPPARGCYVEIRRGSQVIIGRVVWRKEDGFGLRTQDRLDVEAIINEPRLAGRPSVRASGTPSERRTRSRSATAADAARRLDRSRWLSSLMQFGLLVLAGAAAAGILATEANRILGQPFATVAAALSPAG